MLSSSSTATDVSKRVDLRVEHRFTGTCCDRPESQHRERVRPNRKFRRVAKAVKKKRPDELVVFLDSEGRDEANEKHVTWYVAAFNERGERVGCLRDESGIKTKDFLAWLFTLGARHVFGFGTGYDLTKLLADLPDGKIALLVRPELRQYEVEGKRRFRPVYFGDFRLHYLRGMLRVQKHVGWRTVEKGKRAGHREAVRPSVTFWDVFRFYSCPFVDALDTWSVAETGEERATLKHIAMMKGKRAEFNTLTDDEVADYCDWECRFGARLVRKLITAHQDVGRMLEAKGIPNFKLDRYHGAGSCAKALLRAANVLQFSRAEWGDCGHRRQIAWRGR